MAKKVKEEKALSLDDILFKCRDILRNARNSGSFFEKRDLMLTFVPSRYIEFVDRDQSIDYEKVMHDASDKVAEILTRQAANAAALKNAFTALGYPMKEGKWKKLKKRQ